MNQGPMEVARVFLGSIGTLVSQGPMEVARVFLG